VNGGVVSLNRGLMERGRVLVRERRQAFISQEQLLQVTTLVEVLENILPDETEYVAQAWGAVYFSARGIRVPKGLEKRLENRGLIVEIFEDDVSPQVRVELKEERRNLEMAEDMGAQAAYDHYRNTREGEYVPESPMKPDYEFLQAELEREPSTIELKVFEEEFRVCAERYNIEIETYGEPLNYH